MTQKEIIQQIPVDQGSLGHFVPSYYPGMAYYPAAPAWGGEGQGSGRGHGGSPGHVVQAPPHYKLLLEARINLFSPSSFLLFLHTKP